MSVTGLEFAGSETAASEGALDADAAKIQGRSQWQLTWRRLRRDKVAMGSLVVIVVIIALAIAAPLFVSITHHPPNIAYPNTGEDAAGNPAGPGPPGSGSAPTAPAATCSSASSTARVSRCSWASSPPGSAWWRVWPSA